MSAHERWLARLNPSHSAPSTSKWRIFSSSLLPLENSDFSSLETHLRNLGRPCITHRDVRGRSLLVTAEAPPDAPQGFQVTQDTFISSIRVHDPHGYCESVDSLAPVLQWLLPINFCRPPVTLSPDSPNGDRFQGPSSFRVLDHSS